MDRGGRFAKAALLGVLLVVAGVFGVSCGGSSGGRGLTLGNIGWDENVVVANLTKTLLEEELGYENVELRTMDVGPLYEGVGNGELQAFQDVWLPAHEDYVEGVEGDVELLGPWFQGTTRFGIAVPSYMDVTSLEDLNGTGADLILGIEPGAVSMTKIPEEVMPAYGLRQKLVESSTPGMLAEVEKLYGDEEEFAFIAWSPHWMNRVYDFRYLEDPRDAFEEVDDTVQLSTVVNESLGEDDPVAYAFLDAIRLDEDQVNEIEDEINRSDPETGVRTWLENNRDAVEPWIQAGRDAQQS